MQQLVDGLVYVGILLFVVISAKMVDDSIYLKKEEKIKIMFIGCLAMAGVLVSSLEEVSQVFDLSRFKEKKDDLFLSHPYEIYRKYPTENFENFREQLSLNLGYRSLDELYEDESNKFVVLMSQNGWGASYFMQQLAHNLVHDNQQVVFLRKSSQVYHYLEQRQYLQILGNNQDQLIEKFQRIHQKKKKVPFILIDNFSDNLINLVQCLMNIFRNSKVRVIINEKQLKMSHYYYQYYDQIEIENFVSEKQENLIQYLQTQLKVQFTQENLSILKRKINWDYIGQILKYSQGDAKKAIEFIKGKTQVTIQECEQILTPAPQEIPKSPQKELN